jgi:hypothetical protein
MIDIVRHVLTSQFEATLCTLGHCVARCPDDLWTTRVAKYPFCQVAFHTLFFTDYYLGSDAESFLQQPFHLANAPLFADYEQLEYREPVCLYDRQQIEAYMEFVRGKAVATIASETEADLSAPANFARRNFSRAELHIYNIRHVQHHSAQLILRLRLDANVDVPWIGSGWREPAV